MKKEDSLNKTSVHRKDGVKHSPHHQKRRNRITMNISGEVFETFSETLGRFPTTLLGNENTRSQFYCHNSNQYFFERHRLCFESILYFYQSNGTLNCPIGTSIDLFEQECNFFRLPTKFIDQMKRQEGIFPEIIARNVTPKNSTRTFRGRVWNILEHPNTSLKAWTFGLMSISAVLLSVLTATLETMHMFQSVSSIWSKIELSLNVWFLVELILRACFCKDFFKFCKEYINLVDIMAVCPYFMLLVVSINSYHNLMGLFKMFKLLRVCRLFRFSKHSKRLAVVGKILQSCVGSFRLLLSCFLIVIVFGGAVMFNLEPSSKIHEDSFYSIPASLWWCVQTLTTVGYGDITPKTFVGRAFACFFMLLGVATISLPILTIISQFARLYPKNIELVSNAGEELVGGTSTDGLNRRSLSIRK